MPEFIYPPQKEGLVHPVPLRKRGEEDSPQIGVEHLITQPWLEFFLTLEQQTLLALTGVANLVVVTDVDGVVIVASALPAVDGSLVTNLTAANIVGVLPAASVDLSNLDADNLTSGRVPQARRWTQFDSGLTGTVNDMVFDDADLIICSNGAPVVLTGLVAGVAGQRLTIQTAGFQMTLNHLDAGSALANRIQTNSGVNIPFVGGPGNVELVYNATGPFWQVVSHEQGAFIHEAFLVGNYTADIGAWTPTEPGEIDRSFYLRGKQYELSLFVENSTVTAAATVLSMLLPNGITAKKVQRVPCALVDNAVVANGFMSTTAGGTTLDVTRQDGAAFAISASLTNVIGQMAIEVQ